MWTWRIDANDTKICETFLQTVAEVVTAESHSLLSVLPRVHVRSLSLSHPHNLTFFSHVIFPPTLTISPSPAQFHSVSKSELEALASRYWRMADSDTHMANAADVALMPELAFCPFVPAVLQAVHTYRVQVDGRLPRADYDPSPETMDFQDFADACELLSARCDRVKKIKGTTHSQG